MKRIFALLLTVALLSGCSGKAAYDPDRHRYSTETRIVLPKDDQGMVIEPPAELLFFEEAIASDLIIAGRIAADGEIKERPLSSDEPLGPTITTTFFQVEVREVWFGKCSEKEITLSIQGDLESYAAKPLKNDEVVLFLRYSKDLGYYVLTNSDEESIFAINPPDDTLYAFSFAETLTAFDGKEPSVLKKAIKSVYREFSEMTEWDYLYIGEIAYGILPEDSPIYIEETRRREYKLSLEK